ncbi:MAG: CHAT domain-containing protein [Micrococcales bacterium]|nr:CHAT domain-containing protein [Micrococcales bacterium]
MTTPDLESLLTLALSQPDRTLRLAEAWLAESPSDRVASVAHQAICVAERGTGHMREALGHGRAALRHARRVDAERQGDVLATLGATLVYAGRTTEGLRLLEESIPLTPKRTLGRVLHRRAHILGLLGRYSEARADLDRAVRHSHRHGDTLWEGRSLVNRSDVHLALGEVRRAEDDARRADLLLTSLGEHFEAVQARHNQALAAFHAGDLVAALILLDAVDDGYRALGIDPVDLVLDRAQVQLTAGLTTEARAMLDDALARRSVPPATRAELLLMAARAALAGDDPAGAETLATEARKLFAAQQRPRWALQARALALQARDVTLQGQRRVAPSSTGRPLPHGQERRHARDTARLVTALREQGSRELPGALMLHARAAERAGLDAEVARSYAEAAGTRHTGPPLARAAGWLAAARLAAHRGDRRGLYDACRRGLDAVDEHRAVLGDLELRALATGHGRDLAALAEVEAARARDARRLLWWSERWRATSLQVAPPSPSDPALERDAAALRDVTRRLDAAEEDSPAAAALFRERARREGDVRRAYRHRRGTGAVGTGFDVRHLVGALGDTVLISLSTIEGVLHAVTIARGRVQVRTLGPIGPVLDEAQFARFTLRRSAHGRPSALDATATRLEAALFDTRPPGWSAPQVVLVPPPELLTVPWGLLPVFAGTALTVSPSATLWLRARQGLATSARPVPDGTAPIGHVALVTGPGLTSGQREATALSPVCDSARAVGGDEATVAGALDALDGARLAHIAAHGTFRADAPLFSSLSLADGPLTVHDFERLQRPPRSLILSACESGAAAPIGAHEALGLVTGLLAMGTSGVLASIVPVNDDATVAVMGRVHDVVARGGTLADAWLAARQAAASDPLLTATAASFTAWGA